MKLTTKEIAFLAGIYREKTPLSLFANINAPLDGTEEKSLEQKGIYKDGVLSQEAKEMLDTAAGARKCSRVMLKDGFCVIEKYAYRAEDKILLVENEEGKLLFSIPGGWSKTISELSEFTGISRIKNSSMEVLLPPDQMMVLLAIIDLSRKNALISYFGNPAEKTPITYTDIVKHLDEPAPNSFVRMLKKNYNYAVPQAEATKGLLEELTGKNCVRFEKGYELTGEYALFADSFLIPETIVMLEAFDMNEAEEVMSTGVLCACAGIKDIASFIFSGEGIELASISGMQLMQMVENFLNCPDIAD